MQVLGAELIKKAGCIEDAVKALNNAREEKLGDHLEAAKRKSFKGLSELHASYLKRECAEQGVPSRREQPLVREEAKNHGSVLRRSFCRKLEGRRI